MTPITCSVKEAVAATGLSRDTFYNLMKAGKIDHAVVGGRKVLFVDSLRAYIEACREGGKKQ